MDAGLIVCIVLLSVHLAFSILYIVDGLINKFVTKREKKEMIIKNKFENFEMNIDDLYRRVRRLEDKY